MVFFLSDWYAHVRIQFNSDCLLGIISQLYNEKHDLEPEIIEIYKNMIFKAVWCFKT